MKWVRQIPNFNLILKSGYYYILKKKKERREGKAEGEEEGKGGLSSERVAGGFIWRNKPKETLTAIAKVGN